MNREIKFRAWDKQNKTMGIVNEIKMSPYLYTQVKYSMEINGKRKDEWSLLDDNGHGTCVLMQDTGLKDKNGKEIYEGDIVTYEDGEYSFIAKVVWGDWLWFMEGIEPRDNFDFEDFTYNTMTELEVIGNIYENPELLEVENESL